MTCVPSEDLAQLSTSIATKKVTVIDDEQNASRADPDEMAHYDPTHLYQHCLQNVFCLCLQADQPNNFLFGNTLM